jgi:hypothetical protein
VRAGAACSLNPNPHVREKKKAFKMLGITDIPDEVLDIMRQTQAPISQKHKSPVQDFT